MTITVRDIKDYYGIPHYKNIYRALDERFEALTERVRKLEEYKRLSWDNYMEQTDSLRAKDLVIERDAYLEALAQIGGILYKYAPGLMVQEDEE